MADLLEFRLSKLARMSFHLRQLADGYLAPSVSAEIAQVADEYESEVVRIERECWGKRSCPCEFSRNCISCNLPSFH
ncbi:MAG TPA: hypothetical protein VIF02_09160 [Methylocella sp.]|jgi:hypothetical protein